MLRIREYTRDLSEAARTGKLERAFGMNEKVRDLLRRATGPSRRSILIVGPNGVGKTTLVHALASNMAQSQDEAHRAYRIVEVDLAAIRTERESVEETSKSILTDLKESLNTIAFIDGIGPIFLLKDVQGDQTSIARVFEPAIKQRYIACIGTLTYAEYDRVRKVDPTVDQTFEIIELRSYQEDETRVLLKEALPDLELQHDVKVSDDAIEATLRYTKQYMPDEAWPGKAIEVLDQACARYKLKQRVHEELPEVQEDLTMRHLGTKVSPHDVKRVVTEITSIDIDAKDAETWRGQLASRLSSYVYGQQSGIKRLAAAITAAKADFGSKTRPFASLLIAGPRGVGKLHACKILAQQLYGEQSAAHVFDMIEYVGESGTAHLLGASQSASELTETPSISTQVRSGEFSICVFEGIQNADPSFFDALIPMLSTGVLRDAHHKKVNLHRCAIVLTLDEPENGGQDPLTGAVPPEVLTLLDGVINFDPLGQETVRKMIRRRLEEFHTLLKPHGVGLRIQDAAFDLLEQSCFDPASGADNMPERMETLVLSPLRGIAKAQGLKPGLSFDIVAGEAGIAVTTSSA
jgi:ATP-dependent Clp protease ATP-binding subunit ClpC